MRLREFTTDTKISVIGLKKDIIPYMHQRGLDTLNISVYSLSGEKRGDFSIAQENRRSWIIGNPNTNFFSKNFQSWLRSNFGEGPLEFSVEEKEEKISPLDQIEDTVSQSVADIVENSGENSILENDIKKTNCRVDSIPEMGEELPGNENINTSGISNPKNKKRRISNKRKKKTQAEQKARKKARIKQFLQNPLYSFLLHIPDEEAFHNGLKEVISVSFKLAQHIRENKIENIIFIDASARTMYLGVIKAWHILYPQEKIPALFFINPTKNKGASLEGIHTHLLRRYNRPTMIFDTCIHTGKTMNLVKNLLERNNFSDISIGVFQEDNDQNIINPHFIGLDRRASCGCYPFARDANIKRGHKFVCERVENRNPKIEANQINRENISKVFKILESFENPLLSKEKGQRSIFQSTMKNILVRLRSIIISG